MTDRAHTQFVISFMSANYVAEALGYGKADEWGPFDDATNRAFAPIETFATRFDDLLSRITGIGFETIDLWFGHVNPGWATPEHVAAAREAVARHGVRVVSLAGSVGATTEDLAAACRLANALEVDLIVGLGDVVRRDRAGAADVLRGHGVRFALENHAEKTPQEVLDVIGDEDDVLGSGLDTGWWATQGYDPVTAIEELKDRLFHVHVKDVEAPGTHVTCMYGEGCARIADCIEALLRIGYEGALSVEHEPYDRDPTSECARMLTMLRERLPVEAAGRG